MTEKTKKRKLITFQIESVFETTCRVCVFGGSNKNKENCVGCKAGRVLKELGDELNGGETFEELKGWTTEQDQELINLFSRYTAPEIAEITGRKREVIRSRIETLRKNGADIPKKQRGGYKRWTPKSDEMPTKAFQENSIGGSR